MKIDTINSWYRGLGDIVCYAWLGQGMFQAQRECVFYATDWRAELLRSFQLEVTNDRKGAVSALVGYETCIKIGSPLGYLEWIGKQLGLYDEKRRQWIVAPARPHLSLPPMERDMGRKASATVLMFPECYSPSRTWPRAYFIELGQMLQKIGVQVKVVYEKRDGAFTVFHDIYEQSILFVTGAIQQAELIICNDSGPAHLAGTIGTKALAIHGMTTPRIYSYLNGAVTSFVKKSLGCSGCHALSPPYRHSCGSGCHELYRTYPEEVFAKAVEMLGLNQAQEKAA